MIDTDSIEQGHDEVRICVIDDDEEVLEITEKILEIYGYTTLGLSTAIGASNRVNRFKPHVIILDIKMPALDGGKLLDIFRSTLHQTPKVILFSGRHPQELEALAREVSADDFVYKGASLSFIIYPRLELRHFVFGVVAVTLTSVVASVWPAALASRLEPVEALRS